MSFQTAPDIPLLITSTSTSSERRVSPGWTLEHFKARMEAVTGIPPSVQSLTLKLGGSQAPVPMVGEQRTLGEFGLGAYGEIEITDTRPPGLRESFTDTSTVPKYSMDPTTYESLTDTVLAFKKQNKLGRFDPQAPDILTQKTQLIDREVSERHIVLGARCQLLAVSPTAAADARRGTVRYIGPVPEIPGGVGSWVGVELDEPVGKNDGSVGGTRYFECGVKCGVFVRPARVEVGDFEALDELGEEMEEM